MRSETMTSGRSEWLLYGIDKRSYDYFDDRKIRDRVRCDFFRPLDRDLCDSRWSVFLSVFCPPQRIDRGHAYSDATANAGRYSARSKGFTGLITIIFVLQSAPLSGRAERTHCALCGSEKICVVVDAGQFLCRDDSARHLFLPDASVDAHTGSVSNTSLPSPQVDHTNPVGHSFVSTARDSFPIWLLRSVSAVCADASGRSAGLCFLRRTRECRRAFWPLVHSGKNAESLAVAIFECRYPSRLTPFEVSM